MAGEKGTILITGGSGFVGGNVIKYALEHGYNVRATARSESSAKKIADEFSQYKDKLSFTIVPDIIKKESYKNSFNGVTGVIHTASPFVLNPKDNVTDLLEPAIQGSIAVLEAAKSWGPSVKRIVTTSSHASVADLSKGKRPGYVYDEKDWNPVTYEEAAVADGVTAYCASKTLAERAEWDWIKEQKPSFDLVTICPPWIFGPYATELRSTKHLSESVGLLYNMLDAKEVPPFDFGGYADVREVAAAHVLALEVPEAGNQRFWVGNNFNYQLAADAARAEIPELRSRIPEGRPGYVEDTYKVDGSKATRVLGLKYLTLKQTIADTYHQLLHAEQVEASA
ncbi:hypothetical protein BX600DRAFT_479451 [Xylariales sp. PMI_506]|nr:hypothetical protein BX600DRAFT_479451 [Xylariales sp. PMI_506]